MVDVFVRFTGTRETHQQLGAELRLILRPTRAEPGCIRIRLYESLHEPPTFAIHSTWVDEAAFDAHTKLPYMTRFLRSVSDLVTQPVHALRTSEIL